jgi:hypothetical protein
MLPAKFIFMSTLLSFILYRKTGIPVYASYKDGERHMDILETVDSSTTVIEIIIYADGLDRDQMGHTSARNKIHVTYVLILNLTCGRPRSADDYHLLQVTQDEFFWVIY